MTFWRLLNLELWLQEFFDEHDAARRRRRQAAHVKTDYEPNARKQLDLVTARRHARCAATRCAPSSSPARTTSTPRRSTTSTASSPGCPTPAPSTPPPRAGRWYFFISEKIVAITQGRSYFIWDIKVGRPARVLSPLRHAHAGRHRPRLARSRCSWPSRRPACRGCSTPPPAAPSARCSARKGLFYELVGNDIRAIDGPTEYSVYPANVSAKLAPKDPDDVAARLSAAIRARVPEAYREHVRRHGRHGRQRHRPQRPRHGRARSQGALRGDVRRQPAGPGVRADARWPSSSRCLLPEGFSRMPSARSRMPSGRVTRPRVSSR